MAVIQVEISSNRLEARLTIEAVSSSFPVKEEILAALQDAGVTYGVIEQVIDQITDSQSPVYDKVVARGTKPVGPIELIVRPGMSVKTVESINERVDFKSLEKFEKVTRNQKLVRRVPVEEQRSGQTVTGATIPNTTLLSEFPKGENTIVSEDGNYLLAKEDGYLFIEGDRISVSNVYHVKGDVNYATGNIHFSGRVIIDGDVRSGFRLEATDTIFIGGNVEASNVYSQNGDIVIEYGVVGKNRARILAGGSLKCGFVQEATIGVKKNIYITHYAINSTMTAGGMVVLQENEGTLRGGTTSADQGITARVIGSINGIETEVSISQYSVREDSTARWEMSRQRADILTRITTLEKRIKFLQVLGEKVGRLSDEKTAELSAAKVEIDEKRTQLNALEKEEVDLIRRARKENLSKEIRVLDTIYKNSKIDIGELTWFAESDLSQVKIYRFKDEILVESLREIADIEYDVFVPQ